MYLVACSSSRRLIRMRALCGSAGLPSELVIGPVVPGWRGFFKDNNSLISPLHQLALPGQRMPDDGRQLVELRLPAEHAARAIGARDKLRRIAGAATRKLDLEVDA